MSISFFKQFLLSLVVCLFLTIFASAQVAPTFVYTNNETPSNSVSAFQVSGTGALTEITGSPFSTGGTGSGGGLFAATRNSVATMNNFMYVANSGSGNVTGFTANVATGALTIVPGSPFSVGGVSGDISLSGTPNGKFLFVVSDSDRSVRSFSVGGNGALTQVIVINGVSADGVRVSPDGSFFALASPNGVRVFSIDGTGALIEVTGSPFTPRGSAPADVEFSKDTRFLFSPTTLNSVSVFSVAANGSLREITGSPFSSPGSLSLQTVTVSPNNQFLFAGDPGPAFFGGTSTVAAFSIGANGTLTEVAGSPFSAGISSFAISKVATDATGTFLYGAAGDFNLNARVVAYNIATNGVLTAVAGSPFTPVGISGQTFLESLAVFSPFIVGTASLQHNSVYAADTSNSRIQRSTDQGVSWQLIGFGAGTNPGQFNGPKGVSADFTDKFIFVADTNNNRIQRSTDGGITWQVIAKSGSLVGLVSAPQGIAYDENRDILYIADTNNSRIQIATSASKSPSFSVFAGATAGTVVGKVSQPRSVAVNAAGLVYVADTNNNRIQMNTTGATGGWVIFAGATAGTALGKMNSPRAIFVDDSNNVYVADTSNNRIQMNTTGMTGGWSVLSGTGTALGIVNLPEGIVVSAGTGGGNTTLTNSTNIFIGDTGNFRIERLSTNGGTAVIVGPPGTNVGLFNQPTGVR